MLVMLSMMRVNSDANHGMYDGIHVNIERRYHHTCQEDHRSGVYYRTQDWWYPNVMLEDLPLDNDGPLDEFNLPLFSARSVSEISSISDEDHNVYNPSFKQRWNILKMINGTLSM